MRELMMRLRDWFRRDTLDRELAEELRFHKQRLERDAVVDGYTPATASTVAARKFGNVTNTREESRDRWSIPSIESFLQDVRYAVRGLRRSPGFTITVVLTLGLGIGANAAMFGAVDRLMFRAPPGLRMPNEVHRVYFQTTSRGRVATNTIAPYARFLDMQRWTRSFSQFAAFAERSMPVGSGESSREEPVVAFSASLFNFFDVRPAQGRFFVPAEDSIPAGANVVVLSYGFWQSEFGGKDVIGQSIQIGRLRYTIIGVAPEGFVGVASDRSPVAFIPITTLAVNEEQYSVHDYYANYRWDFASMIVRRRPGVSEEAASADLTQAFVKSRENQRSSIPSTAPATVARPQAIAGAIKQSAGPGAGLEARTLLWVTGVAIIVLLIACANVANLMFARVLRRKREIAMRLALGVSRPRLMSQLLTESMLLAALGCVAGVAFAGAGSATLRMLAVSGSGNGGSLTDWRTLVAASACACAAGLITAVGPALLAARSSFADVLRGGSRGGAYQHSRIRTSLLVLQGTLSVVLLVGAGLFVRSLDRVRTMRLGYDADAVLLGYEKFRGVRLDSAATVQLQDRLVEAAHRVPGVDAISLVNSRPFANNSTLLFVEGIDSVQRFGRFVFQTATPEYFKTMNTRILRGRAFTATDNERAPLVSVVSEAMAKTLWPGKDPIGQCIRVTADTMPCTTVIGVAEDAVYNGLVDDKRFTQYAPLAQTYPTGGNKFLVRIANGRSAAAVESVRRELQRVMPGDSYITLEPLEDIVDAQRRSWTLGATMFVALGMLALIVAAVGLYGVISYNVAQRMHELGIRVALGAQSADVVRLVVGQGVSFALSGVAIGTVVALFAARWMQPLLFDESAKDPLIYSSVSVVLVVVALLASAIPAMRATRADPNAALRTD